MNLLASMVWAYAITTGCGIMATLNPNELHYRHTMDELNCDRAQSLEPGTTNVMLT
jgi:hypothetical protein